MSWCTNILIIIFESVGQKFVVIILRASQQTFGPSSFVRALIWIMVFETDFSGTLTFDTLPFGHIDFWLIDFRYIDNRYTWLLTGEPQCLCIFKTQALKVLLIEILVKVNIFWKCHKIWKNQSNLCGTLRKHELYSWARNKLINQKNP